MSNIRTANKHHKRAVAHQAKNKLAAKAAAVSAKSEKVATKS